MHGKIPQECMQTVIVPICKIKNGNISDAGNYRPPLQLPSPSCLNTTSRYTDCISAEHLLYADESLRFFLSELFNMCIVHTQFLFKHNNSSHMQKQEREYV